MLQRNRVENLTLRACFEGGTAHPARRRSRVFCTHHVSPCITFLLTSNSVDSPEVAHSLVGGVRGSGIQGSWDLCQALLPSAHHWNGDLHTSMGPTPEEPSCPLLGPPSCRVEKAGWVLGLPLGRG